MRELNAIAEKYPLGTTVRKVRGSNWHGRIVGYYKTDLTPQGVAVESDLEKGSVQIYLVQALEVLSLPDTTLQLL
jgi:dihydrofolate reductase (trimethoprim resistance protein)